MFAEPRHPVIGVLPVNLAARVCERSAGRFAEKLLLTTENNLDTTIAERARRYRARIVKAGKLRNLKDLIVDWMRP